MFPKCNDITLEMGISNVLIKDQNKQTSKLLNTVKWEFIRNKSKIFTLQFLNERNDLFNKKCCKPFFKWNCSLQYARKFALGENGYLPFLNENGVQLNSIVYL